MLIDCRGQGKGHIALITEEVLVKALDHHDNGNDTHRHHAHDERKNDEPVYNVQPTVIDLMFHRRGRDTCQHRQCQHRAEKRQHNAPARAQLMFYKLTQHLNTSLNRASTLLPYCSLISSTLDCMFTLPSLRKMTSSSAFSTSLMRWVEMMTLAFSS